MSKTRFSKPFTQQEAIPQAGIDVAVELLRSGRLHRYNTIGEELAESALLEREFAAYMDQSYCLACTSGGYAMHIALRAAGLEPGEAVLTNAFTLAPVPGAIDNAGGKPVLVEIDRNYCVDLDHLESRMKASGARFFLISHMRGHLADMDAVEALCENYGVTLIEDCAHTMGAQWNGRHSGTFGKAACFSTQTYKRQSKASTRCAWTRRTTAGAWTTCAPRSCGHSYPASMIIARVGTTDTARSKNAFRNARTFSCHNVRTKKFLSAARYSFAWKLSIQPRSANSFPPARNAVSN